MRIVARIEKLGGDKYHFEGKIFDSFLTARRAMVERMRVRRLKRHWRASRLSVKRMENVEFPPLAEQSWEEACYAARYSKAHRSRYLPV